MSKPWIRFEDGRQRSLGEYGSILKDGRLIISNEIALASGVTPGVYCEIFYQEGARLIGIKPMPARTPYSVKVSTTGKVDDPFDQIIPGRKGGRLANSVVPLKSLLTSRHIGLASKVRGHMYFDAESELLVFEFPTEAQLVSPSQHAATQMQKGAFAERVAGDVG